LKTISTVKTDVYVFEVFVAILQTSFEPVNPETVDNAGKKRCLALYNIYYIIYINNNMFFQVNCLLHLYFFIEEFCQTLVSSLFIIGFS
jgi:hypothetical protein